MSKTVSKLNNFAGCIDKIIPLVCPCLSCMQTMSFAKIKIRKLTKLLTFRMAFQYNGCHKPPMAITEHCSLEH